VTVYSPYKWAEITVQAACTIYPDDGGTRLVWNISIFPPHYTASYSRRWWS